MKENVVDGNTQKEEEEEKDRINNINHTHKNFSLLFHEYIYIYVFYFILFFPPQPFLQKKPIQSIIVHSKIQNSGLVNLETHF
jgi:hypothetical protein